ncbi:MAG TPA: hypothetical protein VF796_24075 [Humisphaera sp.]
MALMPLNYRGNDPYRPGFRLQTPVKSMASIAAILCAIASFMVHNAAGKMALAVIAIVAGLIGMVRAVSPNVSGGILSVVAIVVAVFGFLAAIFDAVGFF